MMRSIAVAFLTVMISGCFAGPSGPATAEGREISVPMRAAPDGTRVARIGAILNAERRARGLRPVSYNPLMSRVAAGHAADMSRHGFMRHRGSDGKSSHQRLQAAGYGPCRSAENIGRGYSDARTIMKGWMASPGHRTNALGAEYVEYGVGYEQAGSYWVLLLGRPGC